MKYYKRFLPAAAILIATLSFFAFKGDNHNFKIAKNLEIFNTIVREMDMFYVDTIDAEKVIQSGITSMLNQLDPYTEYYPEDSKTDLKLMTTGKYAGVGSLIRYIKEKDHTAFVEPYENTPAAKAGIKAGDIILKIDGKELKGKSVTEVSDLLRGESGTALVITVERPGTEENIEYKLKRENIQVPSVPYYGLTGDSIGYIVLDGFTENCSKEVRRAVIDLKRQGARSLILDLRGNPGGLLNEAVEIVGLFVPKGETVVYTKGKIRQASRTYRTNKEPLDLDIPLVVMVDGQTASSAEIVAGALQDLDRAVIMGARTYGKGLVQVPRDLPYNGNLKITTAKYYIPTGRCIQAINYAQRNEDGSVARIPDSLTHLFRTAAGRKVRDGGGITPDIDIQPQKISNILYYLLNDNVIFNYVTEFCLRNAAIAPADSFTISDAEYAIFKKYVTRTDFKYDKQSEKALKALKEIAQFEGYFDKSSEEFAALEKKLEHNLNHDLDYFSKEIKEVLSNEIVKRYYYQRGAIANQLQYDTDLAKAKKILADRESYTRLLAPQKRTVQTEDSI